MLVNIRGSNGAGKTTIVRGLMDCASTRQPIYGRLGPNQPEGYRLALSGVEKTIYVLGPYEANYRTGGCDRIQPFDLILGLIDKYEARGHVLFEGILISGHYGRMGERLEKFGREAVIVFLDTSLQDCIEGVKARTANPGLKHVAAKHESIQRVRRRFIEHNKVTVIDISRDNGVSTIRALLEAEPRRGCE